MNLKEKLLNLRWTSPFVLIPHGLSGMISVVSGLVLVLGSLTGNFIFLYSFLFFVYLISTFWNALAGFLISNRAPKEN
jgi:hypothetical protein